MDGSLYDGGNLLTTGTYSLSSNTQAVTGSMAVGNVAGLLNRVHLTLLLATGEKLTIIPRRVEHTAGARAILMFDVEA